MFFCEMKKVLRDRMRKELALIPLETIREQSIHVCRIITEMQCIKEAKSVSVYLNMPHSEIDTSHIIPTLFQQGKRVFIPRCNGNIMQMVRMQDMNEIIELPRKKWNIPEPPLDKHYEVAYEPEELDVILMPGLAFDRGGWRLGHGKGYYDKYLSQIKENRFKKPVTVALALNQQIIASAVPRDEYDQRPDIIVSSESVINST